jgi:phosphoribosylformylglycinamidine cyclo-ligase
VPRMLPDNVQARLERRRWPRPALFDWLQRTGGVSDDEMHRVFNCGIGMVLAVAAKDVDATIASLAQNGETPYDIGEVVVRSGDAAQTVVL